MALQKNSFLLKGGLKITNAEPVDERILFPDGIGDVSGISQEYKDTYYKGLVASTPEGKIYVLTGDTPSSVTSWVDVTAPVATPVATDIQLGENLKYSGETIAPASGSITNAFDAVVGEMVKNELTTAAALNDLNSSVSNIEKNYAKKTDISSVYKIVSADVTEITNSGYSTNTYTATDVPIGSVVNTVTSVVYENKTYPAGTNFVCIKSGDTEGKWDALAGITDIEKVNSAETANSAETLKDFVISGSVSAFTITHEGNVWGINPSKHLVYGVTTTGTGVNVGSNIANNKLELNIGVNIDPSVTGVTKGKVLNAIRLTDDPTAITASVTDYINSAATSYSAEKLNGFDIVETDTVTVSTEIINASGYTAIIAMQKDGNTVQYSRTNRIEKANSAETASSAEMAKSANSANSATNDAEGRNIADAFALLDKYPGAPTKPKVNLAYSTTPALSVVKVGDTVTVTSINFTATTVAGAFNEAADVSPKTIPSYSAVQLVVGVTGSPAETTTRINTYSGLTAVATAITDTFTGCTLSSVTYGENAFKLEAKYKYGATNNMPKTLLGLETTKTGRTADENTAVWTAGTVTSGIIPIPVYGGYPLKTNMSGATTNAPGQALIGKGDTVTFSDGKLTPDITNTEYVLYNPSKTFYFVFPPTTTSVNKFYKIAFPQSLTMSSIKKYNDLAHVYDGDVTYTTVTDRGMTVITINAPAESQAPQYRIIFS